MAETINALTDVQTLELSLVKRGKNRKRFALSKSEDDGVSDDDHSTDEMEILKSVVETPLEDESKLEELFKQQKLSPKAQSAVKGALRILSGFKDELPKDVLSMLANLAGYPSPTGKIMDEGKNKDKEVVAKTEPVASPPAAIRKEDGSINLEAVPEEMRGAIQALWKDQADAIKKSEQLEVVLKEERNVRLKKEYIEKAERDFSHVPGTHEDLGILLKQLHEDNEDSANKVEAVLKAAGEQIAQGALFEQLGSGDPRNAAGGSAWSKIEKMADEVAGKNDGMTHEQAVTKVIETNPRLYDEYEAEKRGGAS